MPASTKPRKAKPQNHNSKSIYWDELRQPIQECKTALSAMALEISRATGPGTVLLTPSDNADFHALKTSTNKDLTELSNHLQDVEKHVSARYGQAVNENNLLEQLNFGETLMTILTRAATVLRPDVERLAGLRRQGDANYKRRQEQQAAATPKPE